MRVNYTGRKRVAAVRRLFVWALATGLLAGCSAAPGFSADTPASPSPSMTAATPSLPPDGVFLTTLGFDNAPATFSIPAAAKPLDGADIPELINVIFDGADGPLVYDYLARNLAGMGFTITARSDDSLLWQDDTWQGAFTMTSQRAGLTLRRQL